MASPVSSITLAPGGAGVHVLVQNSADGNNLPPSDVTWQFRDGNGLTVPSGTVATATPDATGFTFACPSAVPEGTKGSAVATYTPTGASGTLAIADGMAVTALQFVIG